MALKTLAFRPQVFNKTQNLPSSCLAQRVRYTSTTAEAVPSNDFDLDNTDFTSSGTPSSDIISSYDPVSQAAKRTKQLPSSRYRFRAPRYYRGPLHPHQPPHPSNPTARDYIPGPFSSPRLSQTYDNILSHDLMTLYYQHVPFNTPKPPEKQRLRGWDDSSPYHKNRPLRGPRGMVRLDLLDKPINFRNVPKLEAINVSVLLREGSSDSRTTHTAGMIVQAITTQRATIHLAKRSLTKGQQISFTQKRGKPIGAASMMKGEQMWHFLSTFISFVLPRIKEWKGLKARSGDGNGNFTIGLPKDVVELWPEIAVNYDAYKAEMIPGISVTLTTSATNDTDGRMLLAALGIPFDATGQ